MPRSRAELAELAWIWSIVGYSLLRFLVAWGAFAGHGANVWVFGIIDVGTAWPYAKSVAQVCRRAAASEWSRLPVPLATAVATFFAPYAYLWFAAGHMPAGVRAGMIICVSVLLCAATAGVLSKTRKLRRGAVADIEAAPKVIELRVAAVPAADDADGARNSHNSIAEAEYSAGRMIMDRRVDDGPTELLIDLTSGEASLRRIRT